MFATEWTGFAKGPLGHYTCNTLAKALASVDSALDPGARAFDLIGSGGFFSGVIAQPRSKGGAA